MRHEKSKLDMLREVSHEIGQFIVRHRIDAKFRDEAARKTAILETSLDSIITMDIHGRIVDFNVAAETTFDISRDEVVGRPLAEVIIPADLQDAYTQGLHHYLQTGQSRMLGKRSEFTAKRSDGSRFPVELSINVSHTLNGVPFFTGFLRDITKRKQAEEKLLQALSKAERKGAQLQVLFDQSFYFAGMLDLEGVVTEANETSLVLCGYERDQVIGVKFWECPWWSGSKQIQDTIRRAVERSSKGDFYRAELPYWLSDGTQRLVDFVLTPALNERGEVIFTVPTGCDITEKKQIEQRLTMALRAGGMAAWEWTPEASVWTPELYELLGLPTDTPATTEAFFERVHPDDLPRLKEAWATAILGHAPYDEQFRIMLPNGELRWLAGVGEFERNDEGDVIKIVGLNWDVTEEHSVADAIRESEKQAQEASQAKSEFLANMSHEIRTPMTAILGYADLLAKEEHNPEKSSYLQVIKRNGMFLLDIINDILDLSKIEAGKMDVSRERFDLQRVVADVRSTMDVRAREKRLEFVVEFKGKIPATIEGDPKRVKQILVNLVGNAIKFTETGSVRLVVCYLGNQPQPLLQFEVVDTGIGIPEEKLSLLFHPFSQADSSVSRQFGGTGLGLAISQRLARVLGGEITVSSEPGKGSTFSCTVQVGELADVEFIEPRIDQFDSTRDSILSKRRLDCRVLIVDDRRDVRFLTHRILKDAGAEVSLAEDGLEAIRQVKLSLREERTWELILLDMQMPRLDGYQTATRLREMGFQGAIIALTADAMQGDMNLCLQCGCDAYLSKPIDIQKLLQMVAEYTQQLDVPSVAALKVLIVDDSQDACAATQKLLEMRGFDVRTAFDGASALREAESFVPNSIVLDITLPDMTGFEVLNRLKELPQLSMTRFYALTGDGRTDDPHRWQRAGFHHHMTKPADLDLLESVLRGDGITTK